MDYDRLVREALRGVVPLALEEVVTNGLSGRHHIYLTFRTPTRGVKLPAHLARKFPETMTIVLRDRFWDLSVEDERFAVTLSFGGVKERIVVPFDAVTAMVDPSVPFGLQFAGGTGDAGSAGTAPMAVREVETDADAPAPQPVAPARPEAADDRAEDDRAEDDRAEDEGPEDTESGEQGAENVVRLTDFRKPRS